MSGFSAMRLVSIGVVAQDKNDNSPFIAVFLKEAHPFHEGDISPHHVTTNYQGTDKDGKDYSVTLQSGMTVKCRWKSTENRITAPSVKKGDEVEVYEVGDTGVYYWSSLPINKNLRRAETVVYAWNASKSPLDKDEQPNAKNHYLITVDGKNGNMTISTSKANGEKAAYTLQINGKDGHLSMVDDLGAVLQIDSVKGNFILGVTGDISLSSKNTVLLTEKFSVKAKQVYMDSPTVVFNGNFTVKGDTNIEGALKASTVKGILLDDID